jgi:hypothetical protein
MRILEIDSRPIAKSIYAEETVLVGTGIDPIGEVDVGAFDFSLSKIALVRKLLSDQSFDVVFVTHSSGHSDAGVSKHSWSRDAEVRHADTDTGVRSL